MPEGGRRLGGRVEHRCAGWNPQARPAGGEVEGGDVARGVLRRRVLGAVRRPVLVFAGEDDPICRCLWSRN
jgi:hypothetical protein